jgi:hypothetical protein
MMIKSLILRILTIRIEVAVILATMSLNRRGISMAGSKYREKELLHLRAADRLGDSFVHVR